MNVSDIEDVVATDVEAWGLSQEDGDDVVQELRIERRIKGNLKTDRVRRTLAEDIIFLLEGAFHSILHVTEGKIRGKQSALLSNS